MALFRQRIQFPQFIADLITCQFDFLASNFDKLIVLADESHALGETDRQEIFEKTHALIVVNILLRCTQYFSNTLSSEAAGEAVSMVYGKYLTEYRNVPKAVAEQKMGKVLLLLDLVSKAEVDVHARNADYRNIADASFPSIVGDVNKQQFYLCSAFAAYCAGDSLRDAGWESKRFAAFRLAKGIVGGDIVGNARGRYRVIF